MSSKRISSGKDSSFVQAIDSTTATGTSFFVGDWNWDWDWDQEKSYARGRSINERVRRKDKTRMIHSNRSLADTRLQWRERQKFVSDTVTLWNSIFRTTRTFFLLRTQISSSRVYWELNSLFSNWSKTQILFEILIRREIWCSRWSKLIRSMKKIYISSVLVSALSIIIMKRTLIIGLTLIHWALAVAGQSTKTNVFVSAWNRSTFAWI